MPRSGSPHGFGGRKTHGKSDIDGGGESSMSGASRMLESGAPSIVSKASSGWRAASHIGSVVDDWPMYSSQQEDYILGPAIGFGASSVVYQASFQPLNGRACAVKVIDLEAFGRDLAELRRETQLMSLSKHPNVLRVRGCWVEGRKLHIATRLMNAGSMLDIMRFSFPDGFEEVVIATVLKQALEGLNYLHINGWLHRDIKAANMLVDDDGTVLMGDFGVGVYLTEGGKSSASGGSMSIVKENGMSSPSAGKYDPDSLTQAARKSFVGTPCWMAPEVVERKSYGAKADIWSFGITALELASGRAPHSRLPPAKILLRTLQDDPPQLDRQGGAYKYSKVFDDFIKQCLQKDPSFRPSAERLLQHGFFKQARGKKYLVGAILSDLPPLAKRQERQRAMSIASLQNQQSWDFGSIHARSRMGSSSSPLAAGGVDEDPFQNFAGIIASPKGSMRVRNSSIGEAEDDGAAASSLMGSISSLRKVRPQSGADIASWKNNKSSSLRDRSSQRQSVSFDVDGGVNGKDGVATKNDNDQACNTPAAATQDPESIAADMNQLSVIDETRDGGNSPTISAPAAAPVAADQSGVSTAETETPPSLITDGDEEDGDDISSQSFPQQLKQHQQGDAEKAVQGSSIAAKPSHRLSTRGGQMLTRLFKRS